MFKLVSFALYVIIIYKYLVKDRIKIGQHPAHSLFMFSWYLCVNLKGCTPEPGSDYLYTYQYDKCNTEFTLKLCTFLFALTVMIYPSPPWDN